MNLTQYERFEIYELKSSSFNIILFASSAYKHPRRYLEKQMFSYKQHPTQIKNKNDTKSSNLQCVIRKKETNVETKLTT